MAKKETKKLEKEHEEKINVVYRNLSRSLEVFKNTTHSVVDWSEDMSKIITLLEETGNDRINLSFIKEKIKNLDYQLEKETTKLILEAEQT